MPEVPAADVPASWRKRHPVLSRVLLYSVGAALVGLGVWLLVGRLDLNRQDRVDYLRSRLDGMDLLLAQDPDGQTTLRVLDEEFAGADVPANVQRSALRVRAFAYLKGGRSDKAHEALDRVEAQVTDESERAAVAIERSQLLTSAGRPTDALAVLDGTEIPADEPALFLWRALARAQALAATGQAEQVVSTLEEALEALPRPLPDAAPVFLANSMWTPREAAFHATSVRTDLTLFGAGARPWTRLLELCPADFEAAVQVARQLDKAGHDAEAAISWARARELDPASAATLEERHEDLRRIAENLPEGLKPREGNVR